LHGAKKSWISGRAVRPTYQEAATPVPRYPVFEPDLRLGRDTFDQLRKLHLEVLEGAFFSCLKNVTDGSWMVPSEERATLIRVV
jgi:hypothetical protein